MSDKEVAQKQPQATPESQPELGQLEQEKKRALYQTPILDASAKCAKCGKGPLMALPHDNAQPSEISFQCAACGHTGKATPRAPQE